MNADMRNSSALPVIRFSNFALLFALITLFPPFGRAGTWVVFGPKTYTQATGAPVAVTDTFSLRNPATQYVLKVSNTGLPDGGVVLVNGVRVIGPHSFNHQVSEVALTVRLLPFNTISVRLKGKPGGALTIEITGVDNDPPTIVGRVSPPPDAGGYNSSPAKVTFACADALSGIASCSPPVAVTTEGTTTVTGTATDLAGNIASASVTVNISLSFFKIRSWQTNPPGDPLQTGKCLDYGVSPIGNGATVFLNDCSSAHPIRVWEVVTCVPDPNNPGNSICGPRTGNGIDPATGQPIVLHHEVMLFAGSNVIGIHNPPANTLGGPSPSASATSPSEFPLGLQIPWTSPHANALTSSPANQIFALDGDSIILESSRPCVNSASNLCPPPPPQLVIQVQNARGANFSPLAAGERNLADNEFWDFVPLPDSQPYPTQGFILTNGSPPTPVTSNWQLWNAICADLPQATATSPPASTCSKFNVGWGSVVVVAGSDPKECANLPDVGPCLDFSGNVNRDSSGKLVGYPPLVLPPGVTLRGNRRGVNFGPQLYAAYIAERDMPCAGMCMIKLTNDYARVTGLRVRGQSRSTDKIEFSFGGDGIGVDYVGLTDPLSPPQIPRFPLSTVTSMIAIIDHNDMSDWEHAPVAGGTPFSNSPKDGNRCGYLGYSNPKDDPPDLYKCDENFRFAPNVPNSLCSPQPSCSQPSSVAIAEDPIKPPGAGTLANLRVTRNFLHHNLRDDGGYGVAPARALIDGNTFLQNRHDISTAAEPHNEYRASHNLVLSSAYGHYGTLGLDGRLQDFDMHGTANVPIYAGGAAGYYVEIDGNTFLGHIGGIGGAGHDYVLRGYPIVNSYYHDNRSLRTESDAVQFVHCVTGLGCTNTCGSLFGCNNNSKDFPISVEGNGNQWADSSPPYTDPTARLGVGDFDGDGDDDLFLATGASWYYSPAGAREWRFLNGAHETIDQLLFGDFDGDGRTDVVAIRNGQLVVSWGGISSWQVLNSNGLQCSSTADMAVGKFLDHPVGDRRDDIFCANGLTWFLSYGGSGPFNFAVNRAESSRVKDLRFADFNGDGKTDVFGVGNSSWQVSFAQSGDPALSNWTPLPVSLTNTVDGLYVADFKGDGKAAVVTYDGCEFQSSSWCIWREGSQGWQYFALDRFGSSDVGDFGTNVAGFGNFLGRLDANGQRLPADLLLWAGTEFWISVGATTTPKPYSTQDMR
jgi:hypothetical protein